MYVGYCILSFLLALRLPRLGKRELILVLLYVLSICVCLVLSVSSSSLCLGMAAVCDCGIPLSFLLPFFELFVPHLLFFRCLWKAVPSDCSFSWVTSFISAEYMKVNWKSQKLTPLNKMGRKTTKRIESPERKTFCSH